MPLDGLRAWIGEVERKLGMRTRVFLVLAAIAVGGAGAAIYLAVEAHNDQVSADDLHAVAEKLQTEIAAQEAEPPEGAGGEASALELEVRQLQAKVKALEGAREPSPPAGEGRGKAKP
jgi:hypothetical protein